MIRWLALSIFAGFVVGCASLCPPPKQALFQDQVAFVQAFEEFEKSYRVAPLHEFLATYPDSDWASHAETAILYARELDNRKAQIEQLQDTVQQRDAEISQLQDTNRHLSETIEQLKSLLIQLERHPN